VEEDINSAEARTEGAMDVADVIATRQNLMSPTYASFQTFNEPVVLESAFMQYCYGPAPADSYSTGGGDGESGSPPGRGGVKYTDLLASNLTISVGHAHPRVLHAAKAQMDKAPHLSSMYYTEPVARLTKKLLATFPPRSDGEKWQVLYAVTGTEAVELALQLARVATGNIPVLSMTNSYHGSCGVAMGCSGTAACRHPFPETGGILHLPSPINLPAGEAERSQAVTALVQSARDTVMSSTCGKVSSFIFEPLQGYGGIHVLPPEYLQQMSEVTRQHGGLVIADEIQTGLGRMGHPNFWGYQMSGIEPDVVIVGKGLGNGFPISAVVCKESVFARFAETKKFIFSTYGANCVAAAVASEVLDVGAIPCPVMSCLLSVWLALLSGCASASLSCRSFTNIPYPPSLVCGSLHPSRITYTTPLRSFATSKCPEEWPT